MSTQLWILKDFDSFTMTADYFEMVYDNHTFRFGYTMDQDHRQLSVKSGHKLHVFLEKIRIQEGVWNSMLLELVFGFTNIVKFAQFIEKLSTIAGFHRVERMSFQYDSDHESDEESDESSIDENSENQVVMARAPEPLMFNSLELSGMVFVFIEDENQPLNIIFTPAYIQIHEPQKNQIFRFAHGTPTLYYMANPKAYRGRKDSKIYGDISNKQQRVKHLLMDCTLQAVLVDPPQNIDQQNVNRQEVTFDATRIATIAAPTFVHVTPAHVMLDLSHGKSLQSFYGAIEAANYQRKNEKAN